MSGKSADVVSVSTDSNDSDEPASMPACARAGRSGFNLVSQVLAEASSSTHTRADKAGDSTMADSDSDAAGRVDFSKQVQAQAQVRPRNARKRTLCPAAAKPSAKRSARAAAKPAPRRLGKLVKPKLKRHTRLGRGSAPARKHEQLQRQHSEFTDDPNHVLGKAFEWNSIYTQRLQTLCAEAEKCVPPKFSGYFEFAGGGGAETASRALSATGMGVEIAIKSQADWNAGKRQSLALQDPDKCVCRFNDIMNCVEEGCRHHIFSVIEETELSQYELHSVLGIERCRVLDESNMTRSASSSSGSSSTTSSCKSSSTNTSGTRSASSLSVSAVSSSDHTDESAVLDPNNHALLSDEALSSKIEALFDKEGRLKAWRPGATIVADDPGSLLLEVAKADHNCSKMVTLKRRPDCTCLNHKPFVTHLSTRTHASAAKAAVYG